MALAFSVGQAFADSPQGAHGTATLMLFGAPLQGATRTQLRKALSHSPLIPIRVDDGYVGDQYNAKAALSGASTLFVAYTDDTAKQFAYASYTFPAFMKAELVADVERLVAGKYGPPTTAPGTCTWGQ